MDEEDDDLPCFGDNLQDLMNAPGNYPMAIEDLSDDEKEDYYIRDTDALIVAGKIVNIISISGKRALLPGSVRLRTRK